MSNPPGATAAVVQWALRWLLRGFSREGVITQVNQMREMLGTLAECCATSSPETRPPRRKSPCQDDDGGQNLYSDAPRFSDPADLASIRLIVNSQYEVSFSEGQ